MLNSSCISGRHLRHISTSVSLSVDGFPWQETKGLSKIGRGRNVGPCSQHLGRKVCSSRLSTKNLHLLGESAGERYIGSIEDVGSGGWFREASLLGRYLAQLFHQSLAGDS